MTSYDNAHGYAASIYEGLDGRLWVGVAAYEDQGYTAGGPPGTVGDDGAERVYWPTADVDAWPTSVPADRDLSEATTEAARILAEHGWETTEGWRALDDATYADVQRAAENSAVTADHIRALAETDFGGSAIDNTDRRYPVLARDADGDIRVMVADTAIEQGAATLYTRPDLDAWLDGTELSDDDAVQIAVEVGENLAKG